jgi:hypothetical protein
VCEVFGIVVVTPADSCKVRLERGKGKGLIDFAFVQMGIVVHVQGE